MSSLCRFRVPAATTMIMLLPFSGTWAQLPAQVKQDAEREINRLKAEYKIVQKRVSEITEIKKASRDPVIANEERNALYAHQDALDWHQRIIQWTMSVAEGALDSASQNFSADITKSIRVSRISDYGRTISEAVPEAIRSSVFEEQRVAKWADAVRKNGLNSKDVQHVEVAVRERRLAREVMTRVPITAAKYFAAAGGLTLEQYAAQVQKYREQERAEFEARKPSEESQEAFWLFMLMMVTSMGPPSPQDKLRNDTACLLMGKHPGLGMTCI